VRSSLPWLFLGGALLSANLAACDGNGSVFGPAAGEGNYQGSFESDEVSRSYFVHTPPAWELGSSLPLLIALHGVPSSGQQLRELTNLDASADQYGYVVAYPNSVFSDWAVGCACTQAEFEGVSDVRFVQKLIGELQTQLGIDPTRVFVAGYSQGALMAHKLACDLPVQLAGAASVAATMLAPVADQCSPSRPVPMLFFHGTEDQQFPPEGRSELSVSSISIGESLDTWSQINGCSGNPVMDLEPDIADDGTTVQRWTYEGCDPGGDLIFYSILAGGHTWPGSAPGSPGSGLITQDIVASDLISRFFLF
jgi:polyhydroxybutyrate depolymerase